MSGIHTGGPPENGGASRKIAPIAKAMQVVAVVLGPFVDKARSESWMRVRILIDDTDSLSGYYTIGVLTPKRMDWDEMEPGLRQAGWIIRKGKYEL
jgi:hypothetical protein